MHILDVNIAMKDEKATGRGGRPEDKVATSVGISSRCPLRRDLLKLTLDAL